MPDDPRHWAKFTKNAARRAQLTPPRRQRTRDAEFYTFHAPPAGTSLQGSQGTGTLARQRILVLAHLPRLAVPSKRIMVVHTVYLRSRAAEPRALVSGLQHTVQYS